MARDLKLEAAAAFVDGQLASAAHQLSVGEPELQAGGVAGIHHAVELRLGVLQGEVEVAIRGALAARDLALHAHVAEARFHGLPSGSHQLGHRQNARLFDRRRGRRRGWFIGRRGLGASAVNRCSKESWGGGLGFSLLPSPPALALAEAFSSG
jgi:hypothetical protein